MYKHDVFGTVYTHLIKNILQKFSCLTSRFLDKNILHNFIEAAYLPLLRQCWERLLIVEMHFAEGEGLLKGSSPEERFDYFTGEIISSENIAFLIEKYPAFWARWTAQTEQFSQSLEKLICRINADILQVANLFYADNHAVVEEITLTGDMHRGMQQTARICYRNGQGIQRVIYYKPRNLAIDAGLSAFFEWWNENFTIQHRVPAILQKDGYGWACAVLQQGCADENELCAYYRRYGSLIALAYILGATDLHKENVVAAGAYPVIIDCETLFSCVAEKPNDIPSGHHIYTSMLLPAFQRRGMIEISPLTARSHQEVDIRIMANPQRRESLMQLEPRNLTTGKCECEVMLGKTLVSDFSPYDHCLEDGLKQTLEFILANQNIVSEKLQYHMQKTVVRVLFRATQSYVTALNNSWHPDVLIRNEAHREFCRLTNPSLNPDVTEAELKQLHNGDIPYFETEFDTSVIRTGAGETLFTSAVVTPCQNMQRQLACLSSAFINSALEDLRYSLFTYRLRYNKIDTAKGRDYACLSTLTNRQWFNAIAQIILDKVQDQVLILDEGYHCWRTISATGTSDLQAGLTGNDLYEGAAGIGLAFYLTGCRLNKRQYINFANVLADQVAGSLYNSPSASLGALSGAAGSLWAVSFIQQERILHLLPLVQQVLSKLSFRFLSHKWQDYTELDYISGAGGSLEMLLRLYDIYADYPVSSTIYQFATYLFDHIVKTGNALLDENTLLGFAHGTAGVSAVLARYMQYFSIENPQAIRLIMRNVQRETALRSENGWPRLDADCTANASWCHGTAGFGFSRLHIRSYMPADIFAADMQIIQNRFGEVQGSLGLCHGMMADYYLKRALGESGDDILQQIRRETEKNGFSTNFGLNGFELTGAMTGVTSLFAGAAIFLNSKII